jgi:hypothetical protein
LFLATSQIPQEVESIQSSNIRAFLRAEELKGRLSAVSTASRSINRVNKLNFNLHKESAKYGKFKLNTKNKGKGKMREISYEFTLIPKRSMSTIPKKGGNL